LKSLPIERTSKTSRARPVAERAPTSGKPVLIHVEIDANSSFPASPEIPVAIR
jgi:hypothetical protein